MIQHTVSKFETIFFQENGGGGAVVKDPLGLFEHPMSDISIAGEAAQPLPDTFHSLLQTISDLMLLLPIGSSLQQVILIISDT